MTESPALAADPAGLVPRWGAVHIHTDHSDGGISVSATARAARDARLDFIQVTDHNTLAAREREGYCEDVLLLVDVEYSPSLFRNHVIGVGVPDAAVGLEKLRRPAALLDGIAERGGQAWIPHPLGFRNLWCGSWNAPWPFWEGPIGGIEIGAFLVDWVMRLRPWNLRRLFRDPLTGAPGPNPRALELWDRLNARPRAPVVHGFVGIDAHYREWLGGRVHTPRYDLMFRTHNLLVWTPPPTGDGPADVRALREALSAGRFVNVFGGSRDPVLFEHTGTGLRLSAVERRGTRLRLLRHGEAVQEVQGSALEIHAAEPGVYRAEVYRGGGLVALSNPIAVRPERVAGATGAASSHDRHQIRTARRT